MTEPAPTKSAAAHQPPAAQALNAPLRLSIVGRNQLQNRLLEAYLRQHLPDLQILEQREQWAPPATPDEAPPALVLWDCFTLPAADLWIKLVLGGAPDPAHTNLALFNVVSDSAGELEAQAIERNVRGVFYLSDPPALLAKGIAGVLGGELWYSRRITSRMLCDPQRFRARNEAREAMLTTREKEILIAIAAGGANQEIAEELRISLHTVKTHLYNIYKKIDVRNRLEATLWVARYL
jgi:LuxR family transcriptional regulator, positive regulator of biofilm formation